MRQAEAMLAALGGADGAGLQWVAWLRQGFGRGSCIWQSGRGESSQAVCEKAASDQVLGEEGWDLQTSQAS
ncbi:hypothetical protein PPACK8108_LOCUS24334 [Phakopsora pachyrhizi]|uniref:Uncharacterized protein n=1 Tax=Phakopsora pachyrhizi TaxID=170000 RepID=A0AAV0BST3_PHAPC|nr:hypothetical protein PPACK8108_LOCUS24334 [Phakopsora pachyrhizi]